MRFRRLDLLAYGKFTDQSVELPASEMDFHLLYGPNEAGKSTLRSAVVDFLYGIPGQTALNFLHDYNRMRLGAVVESRNQSLELTRRKGNKNTLRDVADEPFADEAMTALLGGGDRAFYERMFALSHERLRQGGQEILEGKGDAVEALFSAAAGVRGLHALRGELEQDAKGLWTPRKSKNARYYEFADELAEASKAKREATAHAREWSKADEELAQARAARHKHEAERGRLVARQSRLQRILRVAPHLRARHEAELLREELAAVRLLPPEAAETLRKVEGQIALAKDRLERLLPEVEGLEKTLAEAPSDDPVLPHASEIEALLEERSSLSRHEGDIIKRQAEAQSARARIFRAAKDLGWAEASEQALQSRSPSRTTRADLDGLLKKRGAIEQRADSARKDLDARTGELQELERRAAELEARPVSASWKGALARAREAGDSAARRAELARAIAKAHGECENALLKLHPWRGAVEELRQPPPVSAQQAVERLERVRGLESAQQRLQVRIREVGDDLAAKELALRQLLRQASAVTPEEIGAARADRDQLWSEIASGAVSVGDVKSDYEQRVAAADGLADKRFDHAKESGERTSLENDIERLGRQLESLESAKADEERRIEALRQDWRRATQSLGDAEFPLGDYGRWLVDRDRAVEKAAALSDAEAALADHDRRVEELITGLRAAWATESGSGEPAEAADLAAWVAVTESAQQKRTNDTEEKARLSGQIQQRRASCESARQAAEEAEANWSKWQGDWRASLAAAGLSESLSPDAASEALKVFNELDDAAKELRDKQDRIGGMQSDLDRFDVKARRLAEAFMPDWAERPAGDIAGELKRRLHDAREAARERARLTQQLEKKRGERTGADNDLTAAQAALRPLLDTAAASDIPALRTAIERSDECRRLDALVAEETKKARDAGSPLDLQSLQAELDAEAETDPVAELSQIESDLEATQQRIVEAAQAEKDAQHTLAAFGAGDAAARAEARRQEALSEMIGVAENWVGATVQARLLEWAIRRYREQSQTPLLQRAGALFRELTLDSFQGLVVEESGEQAVIQGRRPHGEAGAEEIPVEAMSDGTRDQLYLSLRVAALELHLNKGEPLPFLADDLFVNWDNERAKAGLRVLAELSGRTQVLFLTHHEHLLDLAQQALGEHCSVLRL